MTQDALLQALESLRTEVQATRAESRMRGEEHAHKLEGITKRLDNLDRTDGLLANEVKSLGNRVGGFEMRLGRLEEDHAMVKRVSVEGDAAQAEALTAAMHIHGQALAAHRQETEARLRAQNAVMDQQTAMLAEQTEMLSKITKTLGHPMVRRVGWLLGAAIIAYLSSKGFR